MVINGRDAEALQTNGAEEIENQSKRFDVTITVVAADIGHGGRSRGSVGRLPEPGHSDQQ